MTNFEYNDTNKVSEKEEFINSFSSYIKDKKKSIESYNQLKEKILNNKK